MLLCVLISVLAGIAPATAQDASALRARHVALSGQLISNQFKRPLYLESSENPDDLKGDVFALVEQPYALVAAALHGVDRWCDILILHLNVKACSASSTKSGDIMTLSVGRKRDQPLSDAYVFEFLHQVAIASPDYLRVLLNAGSGPLGTSRYRIVLEVVALDTHRSFLHLSYAYTQGAAAGIATRVYLATLGRNKVGFSIAGTRADGQPAYIKGARGVVERNAMRVYLAIEAYLDTLSAPWRERVDRRLAAWHAGIERYPLQLHEMDRDDYLSMKRREIAQLQASRPVAAGQ